MLVSDEYILSFVTFMTGTSVKALYNPAFIHSLTP